MRPPPRLTRRAATSLLSFGLAALGTRAVYAADETTGHVTARPLPRPTEAPPPSGVSTLPMGGPRNALIYVPTSYKPDVPMPLVVALHGAFTGSDAAMSYWQSYAEARKFLLLTPSSRGRSWSVKLMPGGPDAQFIDDCLAWTFARFAVDPAHIAAAGFSDGATYSLSFGLANGDLFHDLLCFSPGSIHAVALVGLPRIFMSHAIDDEVLSFRNARAIADGLIKAGYDVDFHEFRGGHSMPAEMINAALTRFLGPA